MAIRTDHNQRTPTNFPTPRMRVRQSCCDGLRGQPLNSSSGSGSTPELDTAGATAAADTNSITEIADITTMAQDLTLSSGMELALDALGGSTQWVVAGAVGVALVTRADVGALVYVVGSLFNAVFSKVLKKTINQACVIGLACWGAGRITLRAC